MAKTDGAKKATHKPETVRIQSILTLETAAALDSARAALKGRGIFVSSSGFVEIALRELLKRSDLPRIMESHGARARRDRPKR